MSDTEDRALAQQAYEIVRTSLPLWDNLAADWKDAFQFVASHVAVTHEARIAALETALRDIVLLATQQVAGADDPLLAIEKTARNALHERK